MNKDQKRLELLYEKVILERLGVSEEVSEGTERLFQEIVKHFEKKDPEEKLSKDTNTIEEVFKFEFKDESIEIFLNISKYPYMDLNEFEITQCGAGKQKDGTKTLVIFLAVSTITWKHFIKLWKENYFKLKPLLEHELKHIFDYSHKKRKDKLNIGGNLAAMSVDYLNGIKYTQFIVTKRSYDGDLEQKNLNEYEKRCLKFLSVLTHLGYNVQHKEFSAFANELAGDIKAKKQSEYLNTQQFKDLFEQTRVVKILRQRKDLLKEFQWLKNNFDKAKKEQYESRHLRNIVREDNFVEGVKSDKSGDAYYITRLLIDHVEEIAQRSEKMTQRLARVYDLFAPPKTNKY